MLYPVLILLLLELTFWDGKTMKCILALCLNPSFTGTYLLSRENWPSEGGNIGVLILLLLELTFWDWTGLNFTPKAGTVLILLLLELTFWERNLVVSRSKHVSLNPSFTGTYLLSIIIFRANVLMLVSLNPSFTGTYLLRLLWLIRHRWRGYVLILLLLELTFWGLQRKSWRRRY